MEKENRVNHAQPDSSEPIDKRRRLITLSMLQLTAGAAFLAPGMFLLKPILEGSKSIIDTATSKECDNTDKTSPSQQTPTEINKKVDDTISSSYISGASTGVGLTLGVLSVKNLIKSLEIENK